MMRTAAISFLCAGAALFSGCIFGQSADDIARNVDDAVKATKPKPGIRVPEEQSEAAAQRAVCDALEAYSADPSQSLSNYIRGYAERQRVLANFGLNEIDPDAADRLADAASDVSNSQEAADVAIELGC
jgi:hypothetical protein